MSDYRRWYMPGGTYFFTLVTNQRQPILTTDLGRACLRRAIDTVRRNWPLEIVATVLLPDHWHVVISLPREDANYSIRWKRIKEEFTVLYLGRGGSEPPRTASRLNQGERGVWQRRFWEHMVRDEDDLKRCVDYVHWNPVKHNLVAHVRDWPWSSFHRFVAAGEYELDWGRADPTPSYQDPEWGE